jgi:hypothetical protein
MGYSMPSPGPGAARSRAQVRGRPDRRGPPSLIARSSNRTGSQFHSHQSKDPTQVTLTPLSQWSVLAGVLETPLRVLASVPAGCALLLAVSACEGKSQVCTGDIAFTCESLAELMCSQTEACSAAPGYCDSRCTVHLNARSCGGALCDWYEGSCRPHCVDATSRDACDALGSECTWSGSACDTPCGGLIDEQSCRDGPGRCWWITCEGTPLDCEQYSGARCPTALGCERMNRYPYSAQ